MEIRTLADVFFSSVARDLDRHLMFKRASGWQTISSRQFYGYVTSMAHALR